MTRTLADLPDTGVVRCARWSDRVAGVALAVLFVVAVAAEAGWLAALPSRALVALTALAAIAHGLALLAYWWAGFAVSLLPFPHLEGDMEVDDPSGRSRSAPARRPERHTAYHDAVIRADRAGS